MLVVTRRNNEEVVIGHPSNPIGIVRVVETRGDRVRLAFDFDRKINVNRREIADLICPKPGTMRSRHGKKVFV